MVDRLRPVAGCPLNGVTMAANGVKPFRVPQRTKLLDGYEDWLRERFTRHRDNADVVRQDLIAEKGLVSVFAFFARAIRSALRRAICRSLSGRCRRGCRK
jgi:hypothetical protein